ncbi:hypothetical protein ACJMK2_006602 [Sinanodonta woodiana]|uniref:GrpE protein homolog n=1 Tax=Sinanodonta woodiana TaxID=1069815 RepID=A0ABD3VU33_SINWO
MQVAMAVVGSMCVRSLRRLSQCTRSAFLNSSIYRCGAYRLSSTAAETNNKPEEQAAAEKKEGPTEAEKALLAEKEVLQAEVKEYKDKYMRALAETENVRQRMKKQIDDAKIYGIQGFCKDLINVADILGKATESVPKEQLTDQNIHLKNLFEGLTMTDSELRKVFIKHGLVKIDPKEGDKFDPFIHEALFQVPKPENKETGTIALISKTGYKLQDRTIRPALVGVFQ